MRTTSTSGAADLPHQTPVAQQRAERHRELAHLAILSALAIAHPVLEVIGGSPGYFVALRAGRIEATALLAAALCVPPLAFAGLLRAASGFTEPLRRWTHLSLVALLSAALFVPPLHRAGIERPQWLAIPIGIAIALAYRRARPVRDLVTFLGLGLLVVPAVFVASPAVEEIFFTGRLLRSQPELRAKPAEAVERPLPVVVLLFDELPLGVLLDASGRINAERYPGFAELASLSTWYRDATSPSEQTLIAVPTMVTGRQVRALVAPTFELHPDNLFLLLSRTHRLVLKEYWTDLRPRVEKTPRVAPRGHAAAVGIVLGDAARLAATLLWPGPRSAWGDDQMPLAWRTPFEDTQRVFGEFLEELAATGGRPVVGFCHLMAPHSPYQRLPSGQRYTRDLVNLAESKVGPEPDQAVRLLQRAALQTGDADRMVQRLLARLRETGLIDRAVIVVASDHGIAFQAGARYRTTTRATLDEIGPVALFIRAPGEPSGRIVDAPVGLIDLLPTVAAFLGADIPWPVKGRPAGLVDPAQGRGRVMIDEGGGAIEFDDRLLVRRSAGRYAAIIGAGGWDEVWRIGPQPKLVFQEVSSLRVGGRSTTRVRWSTDENLASADPGADFLPALVALELEPPVAANLVVALNGRVATTVPFAAGRVGPAKVLLPPALFARGGNRLQFFLADPAAAPLLLAADGEEVAR